MRFDIRYRTAFTYDDPVVESSNELRAAPASDARQHVLHYDVRTTPSSRLVSYVDYWGTRVDAFGVRLPHSSLEVIAEASVETRPTNVIAASPTFEDMASPAFRDRHLEFLERSAHVDWGPDITAAAEDKRGEHGDDVIGTVLALHRLVANRCTYTPGATYVGVEVDDVFAEQQGVCQDFAHLLVALCRSIGVPARYVSGYFFAYDESGADPAEDELEVQTHAWAEVAIPGGGWLGLDPTNRQEVGVRHIKIGHGRDYDDVAPLRGVYTGPSEHELDVTVQMRRSAQEQQQQ
ncbi:MAG: transglutaminase family protein [Nitriliruptorales bacterium]|nr:transglutaminase family protein [Nitriliruptorales bacterium]